MGKSRNISTRIWSDTWFEDLSPNYKLVFMYLITNDNTNMLGAYETSIRKISFETGVDIEIIGECLTKFEKDNKVMYVENHIILLNFLKHQKFNTNMKKSAIYEFEKLPNLFKRDMSLDINDIEDSWETLCKGFSNHCLMLRNIESNRIESEVEVESESNRIEGEQSEIKKSQPLLPKKITPEIIPYQKIVDYYNGQCKGLPIVKVLSEARKKIIRARWNEHGKDIIKEVIYKSRDSSMLNGDNDRGWTADFNWVFKSENFIKILEGNYDNRNRISNGQNRQNNSGTRIDEAKINIAERISKL